MGKKKPKLITPIEALKTVLEDTITSLSTGKCASGGKEFDEGRLYEALSIGLGFPSS